MPPTFCVFAAFPTHQDICNKSSLCRLRTKSTSHCGQFLSRMLLLPVCSFRTQRHSCPCRSGPASPIVHYWLWSCIATGLAQLSSRPYCALWGRPVVEHSENCCWWSWPQWSPACCPVCATETCTEPWTPGTSGSQQLRHWCTTLLCLRVRLSSVQLLPMRYIKMNKGRYSECIHWQGIIIHYRCL